MKYHVYLGVIIFLTFIVARIGLNYLSSAKSTPKTEIDLASHILISVEDYEYVLYWNDGKAGYSDIGLMEKQDLVESFMKFEE